MAKPIDFTRAIAAVADLFGAGAHDTIVCENGDKHALELELICRRLPSDGALLDLGGGLGVNLLALRNLGHRGRLVVVDRLTEYDESNRMGPVSAARTLFDRYDVELRPCDFWPDYDSGFDAETFDMVTTFETIEHLPGHPRRQLAELARILRHGGSALVSVPNATSLMKRLKLLAGRQPYASYQDWTSDRFFGHYREYTADECKALAADAGLRVAETLMSAAIPRARARHAYHDGRHARVSPRAIALWGNYAIEALLPSLRHSVYVVAQKP